MRHLEGQAYEVAGRHEVGPCVDVRGDVVRGLGAQEWEELFDGVGDGLWGC